MVANYENSEEADIAVLEKQLGVSKEEWLSICEVISEKHFPQRRKCFFTPEIS
jgi:hypothetical protein